VRLDLPTGCVSLLEYGNFDEDPFPELLASWNFASAAAADPTYRSDKKTARPAGLRYHLLRSNHARNHVVSVLQVI
jgi:hypothetical protein